MHQDGSGNDEGNLNKEAKGRYEMSKENVNVNINMKTSSNDQDKKQCLSLSKTGGEVTTTMNLDKSTHQHISDSEDSGGATTETPSYLLIHAFEGVSDTEDGDTIEINKNREHTDTQTIENVIGGQSVNPLKTSVQDEEINDEFRKTSSRNMFSMEPSYHNSSVSIEASIRHYNNVVWT